MGKFEILGDLVPLVELNRDVSEPSGTDPGKSPKYVCITRPRRFGKAVMTNMVVFYFGKGVDSSQEFASQEDKQAFTKFLRKKAIDV